MPAANGYSIAFDMASNLGALGVVFWLVFRTFGHTIPRLAKDFREAIKESRDDFKETLQEQRTDYHAAIKEQHAHFAELLEQEREQNLRVLNVFEKTYRGDR